MYNIQSRRRRRRRRHHGRRRLGNRVPIPELVNRS